MQGKFCVRSAEKTEAQTSLDSGSLSKQIGGTCLTKVFGVIGATKSLSYHTKIRLCNLGLAQSRSKGFGPLLCNSSLIRIVGQRARDKANTTAVKRCQSIPKIGSRALDVVLLPPTMVTCPGCANISTLYILTIPNPLARLGVKALC